MSESTIVKYSRIHSGRASTIIFATSEFFDAIGTPWCITVDDETINNGTVTVRDRDTMEQVTLKLEEVANYVNERIKLIYGNQYGISIASELDEGTTATIL